MIQTENYIMLNGKRVDLTDEQLKALGLYEEPKKSLFERVKNGRSYYVITSKGEVCTEIESNVEVDDDFYDVANYCTDKSLMQQRALHETLNRLLWRFSMENEGYQIDWNNKLTYKYFIIFDEGLKKFKVDSFKYYHLPTIYFYTREIAERAIKEIVLPFMEQHPEFVW